MQRTLALLYICLLGSMFSAGALADLTSPDFALPGPCEAKTLKASVFPSAEVVSGGIPASLPVTLTLPDCPAGAAAALPFGAAPFPVLIFFSGFMVGSSDDALPWC